MLHMIPVMASVMRTAFAFDEARQKNPDITVFYMASAATIIAVLRLFR